MPCIEIKGTLAGGRRLTNFIALYRGESVATAKLVAVSSDRGIVAKFFRELAGNNEEAIERPEPQALAVVRGDGE